MIFANYLVYANIVTKSHPAISMMKALSMDLKEQIIGWYLNDGMTVKEVVALASVSVGFVSNVVNLYCA